MQKTTKMYKVNSFILRVPYFMVVTTIFPTTGVTSLRIYSSLLEVLMVSHHVDLVL